MVSETGVLDTGSSETVDMAGGLVTGMAGVSGLMLELAGLAG